MSIPKIIHQTWKTEDIPEEIYPARWVDTWRDLQHHGYEYKFWTDESLRDHVETYYPWFLETYDNYDVHIKRVDAARYLLLDHYGGIYADLDFVLLKSLDDLLDSVVDLLLGYQIPDSVCNALMGSTPEHPVMKTAISLLQENAGQYVLDATGPGLLTHATKTADDGIYLEDVLPQHLLYPFYCDAVHDNRDISIDDLRLRYPNSVACTMWTASWHQEYQPAPPAEPAISQESDDEHNILDRSAYLAIQHPTDEGAIATTEAYENYELKARIALTKQPRRIAEIGVRWGYSVHAFLTACPDAKYVGFDWIHGKHGGVAEDTFDYVRIHLGSVGRHTPMFIEGNTQTLDVLPYGPYDLIHIDGDHTTAGCLHDCEIAAKSLAPGGLVLIDDYSHIPAVKDAVDHFVVTNQDRIIYHHFIPSWRGDYLIYLK